MSADNVVSLVPNKALAMSPDAIADRLENFAQRVRHGEWPNLQRVVVLLDDLDQVHTPWTYGERQTAGQLVGLLEFVKAAVIRGDDHA